MVFIMKTVDQQQIWQKNCCPFACWSNCANVKARTQKRNKQDTCILISSISSKIEKYIVKF